MTLTLHEPLRRLRNANSSNLVDFYIVNTRPCINAGRQAMFLNKNLVVYVFVHSFEHDVANENRSYIEVEHNDVCNHNRDCHAIAEPP